jgi:hypothetical protein
VSIGKYVTIASAVTFALTTAVVSLAADGNKQKIRFNAADQAAARVAVLRKSDLGSGTGWTGGARKPDLSATESCPNYNPKQSDLVLTGAAETRFALGTLVFDSEAQVLETARMVRLDWRRSVLAPGVLSCLRSTMSKSTPAGTTVLSIQKLGFPHIAQYTAAFRLVIDVRSSGGTARLLVDVVLVGRGRTEIILTTSAPFAARVSVKAAEIRLARILVGRVRA